MNAKQLKIELAKQIDDLHGVTLKDLAMLIKCKEKADKESQQESATVTSIMDCYTEVHYTKLYTDHSLVYCLAVTTLCKD